MDLQWGAAQCAKYRIAFDQFAETKIRDFHQSIFFRRFKQNVVRLQVTVSNFAIVEILDGMAHLVEENLRICFGQKAHFLDSCQQFATFHEFKCNIHGIRTVENVMHFYNARMC